MLLWCLMMMVIVASFMSSVVSWVVGVVMIVMRCSVVVMCIDFGFFMVII